MRQIKRYAIVPLILVALISQGCADELRKGAKTAHTGISLLRALRDTNVSLKENGKIDAEEFRRNTLLLQDGSKVVGELNDRVDEHLKAIAALDPNAPDYADKKKALERTASQDLKPVLRDVVTSLRNLNEQGVLRVKNPEARQQLSDIMGFLLSLI